MYSLSTYMYLQVHVCIFSFIFLLLFYFCICANKRIIYPLRCPSHIFHHGCMKPFIASRRQDWSSLCQFLSTRLQLVGAVTATRASNDIFITWHAHANLRTGLDVAIRQKQPYYTSCSPAFSGCRPGRFGCCKCNLLVPQKLKQFNFLFPIFELTS